MRDDDAGSGPVCSWYSLTGAHGQRWDCAVSLADDQPALAAAYERTDPDAYFAWGTDTPPEQLPNDLPAEP